MSKLEKFLEQGIDNPEEFCKLLSMAANELRSRDMNTDLFTLSMEGDKDSINEVNTTSIRPLREIFKAPDNSLSYIPAHAEKIVAQWEEKNTVTLFRGTRLPDNSSSFDIGGVHTTPQLDVASGYAGGLANSMTGVGRLLKSKEIGFISAYEVSLETKTYKNFQFEDFKKGKTPDSTTTLNDLKDSLKSLAQKPASEFFVDSSSYQASSALKEWQQVISSNSHYEVILPQDTPVSQMYLRTAKGLTKINQDNPQWDQLLARVQEANLRDFYEIKPLESAQVQMRNTRSYFADDAEKMSMIETIDTLIKTEKEQRLNAPWQAQGMKDIALSGSSYMDSHPHIARSMCVGSAMDTKTVHYDERIEKLLELSDCAYFNKWNEAKTIMASLDNTNNINANINTNTQKSDVDNKNKITLNIGQMREQFFKTDNTNDKTLSI